MKENWPHKISEKESFISQYDQTLRLRLEEGPRGLFLYFKSQEPVGLSNAYISQSENEKTLNIAEFYVVPSYRKQGIASEMLEHVKSWGKEEGATLLRIEVDKDLENANRFWKRFGFQVDDTGSRNIFFSHI